MRQKNAFVLVLDDSVEAAAATIASLGQIVPRETILCVQTAGEAIRLMENEVIDIAFLDIELTDTNGFAVAQYMKDTGKTIPYVFLTGHAGYAIDGYAYEPLDFLTKPIDFMRLKKVFHRLEEYKKEKPSKKIAINTDDGLVLFHPEEISYIEKNARSNILYAVDGRQYTIHRSLNEIEEMLRGFGFFRCHQSYLVCLGNIQQLRQTTIGRAHIACMAGGGEVPVSRAKYPELREILTGSGAVCI